MPLEYAGIRVRDLARSIRFYTEGLGLKVGNSGRMAAGGLWQELRDPVTGAVLELNYYPGDPPYREGDELDHLGFRVSDLDGAVARLVGLGARVRIPAFEEGNERLAFLSDPDGVWVELYERGPEEVPPTSRFGA
jgi:lactoylglutathione lyase